MLLSRFLFLWLLWFYFQYLLSYLWFLLLYAAICKWLIFWTHWFLVTEFLIFSNTWTSRIHSEFSDDPWKTSSVHGFGPHCEIRDSSWEFIFPCPRDDETKIVILSICCSFFSVTSLVTTSWLTDSELHRLFGYLKLLVPNGEGEKTNVSVRYLGCWGWTAARSWEQDRGCFLPYGRFSVVLSFLDCLHPALIAACRINNQSSKAGNKISHAQSGTKTQLYLW